MKYLVVIVFIVVCVGFASAQGEKKIAYGILFDNTGSMRQLIPQQQEIANLIVKQLGKDSPVSLYGFATESTNPPISSFAVGLECSSDKQAIEKQISEIGVVGGQTTLLDAIYSGVKRLKSPVKSHCSKSDGHVLIIISDGEDRASKIDADELIRTVQKSGVKLYVIGLVNNLSKDAGFIMRSPSKKSKEFLLTLAKETGGRIVIPKKKDTSLEIVAALLSENYTFPK